MSEFELYDKALIECEKNKQESDEIEYEIGSDIEECLHKNITAENNTFLCIYK